MTWPSAGALGLVAFLGILPAQAFAASDATQYGPLPGQTAEICQPATGLRPNPAILLIHGGGWAAGDKATLTGRCRSLAASGYTVMNIDYRLADGTVGNAWPAALEDARTALSWILSNAGTLGIDPARVGVIGESVGAQMAVFLGAAGHGGGVRCVLEESGPIDLLTAPSFMARVSGSVFLHQPREAAYRSGSPVFALTKASAPMMIVHGRGDDLVPVSQAEELAAALQTLGVAATLVLYDGAHMFLDTATAEHARVTTAETVFLADCLQPNGKAGKR